MQEMKVKRQRPVQTLRVTQNDLGLSERSLFKPVRFAYLRERFLPIVKYEGSRAKDKEKKEYRTNIYEFDLVSFLYEKKITKRRVTEPIYQVVGNEMIDIKLQPYSFLENNINQSMIRQIRYILSIMRRSSGFYNIDHCS